MEFNTAYIRLNFIPSNPKAYNRIETANDLYEDSGDVKAVGGTLIASTIAIYAVDVERYKGCAKHNSCRNDFISFIGQSG
jgi:hypothetical protein